VTFSIAEIRKRAEEHRRRMETDPAYRAQSATEESERKAAEERDRAASSAALRRAEVERVRASAGIARRAWPFLDSPERTSALLAVEDFAGSTETLLVLAGGVGCGKTVAASAWLERAIADADRKTWAKGYRTNQERDAEGLIVKAIDLARAGTFDREFWDRIGAMNFLVVDDLGTEPLDEKGWMVANVRALIDRRYDDDRRTILTTNLNLDAFRERYCADGGRLLDRLRERGAFIEVADGSLRRAM
jgi:DNA replication protein DnaC